MDVGRLVGRNISRLRKERGLAQERVAELAGISQQYLSGLERGRRNPTIGMLFAIARAIDADPAELIRVSGLDAD